MSKLDKAKRIKILIIAFIVIAIVGIYSFLETSRDFNEVNQILQIQHTLISAIKDFELSVFAQSRQLQNYLFTVNPEQRELFMNTLQANHIERLRDVFEEIGATTIERQFIDELELFSNALRTIEIDLHRTFIEGYRQEAIDRSFAPEVMHLRESLENHTQALENFVRNRIDNELEMAQANFILYRVVLIGSVLLLSGLSIYILFGVLKSKQQFREAAYLFVTVITTVLASTTFVIYISQLGDEQIALYNTRHELIYQTYIAELSSNFLTTHIRNFAFTQNPIHQEMYLEELSHNMAITSVNRFIELNENHTEINDFVGIVRNSIGIRILEETTLQSTLAGERDFAIANAFSPRVSAFGTPLSERSPELRAIISERMDAQLIQHRQIIQQLEWLTMISCLLNIASGLLAIRVKWLAIKNTEATEAKKFVLLEKIRNLNMKTKLIVSFSSIIVVFVIYALTLIYFSTQIGEHNTYNTEFMQERSNILLEFHQEFSETRRLLTESFLNPAWRYTATEGEWRVFENRLQHAYNLKLDLADEYIGLVREDGIIPEEYNDSRIYILESVVGYLTESRELLMESLSWEEGRISIHQDHILEDLQAADILLQILREILGINQQRIIDYIREYTELSTMFTIIGLIVAILLTVMLTYIMIAVFSNKIKEIRTDLSLIEQGMFEEILESPKTDELSSVLKRVASISTSIIDEVYLTVTQYSEDHSARLDQEKFRGTYQNISFAINYLIDRVVVSDERNKIMLDATPIATYSIDEDFTILECNKAAVNLFNFDDKKEAIKKSYDMFAIRGFESFKRRFEVALNEGYNSFDWDFDRVEGGFIPCHVTLVRFNQDGKKIIATYIQDLTSLRALIRQEEEMKIVLENNRAKSKFLANMSHEIRTPITAVLGISEMQLHAPNLPAGVDESFAKIYSSASGLLSIINDILDLSKVEAGKMEIVEDNYNIASMLSDVTQLNLAYLGSKPIDFIIDVDENIPLVLRGDEIRIKQVLNNLLSNAIKYTDKGTVNLEVKAMPSQKENCTKLYITIKDTGHGMTPEDLKAIFDEYARFRLKDNRFKSGTGLGMSIVYNMLQLMDGDIDILSEPNEGTVVVVQIDQKIVSSDVLGEKKAKDIKNFNAELQTATKRLAFSMIEPMPYGKVLVVDDIEVNIYVAAGLMELYQLQVDSCESGVRAIEKIKEGNTYDVIFMDHMMPELDGVEAVKIIRELGYTAPIVALTANAIAGQAEEFLRKGFDGFLSKPIQTVQLNAVLHKFVKCETKDKEVFREANVTVVRDKLTDMRDKLRRDFLRTQKNTMKDLYSAISAGETKTAHRIAHTLKGLSGLINEQEVEKLAAQAEAKFKEEITDIELLDKLDVALDEVLQALEETYPTEKLVEELSEEETTKLFGELEALLRENRADVLHMVEELEKVPNTKKLVQLIEDMEFAEALKILEKLKT